MKVYISFLCMIMVVCFLILPGNADCAVRQPVIEYENGLVTLSSEKMSLSALLSQIADAAGIGIYIADKLTNQSNAAEFKQEPLQEVLESLLKGYSFAVIFSRGSHAKGQVFQLNENRSGYAGSVSGRTGRIMSEKRHEFYSEKHPVQRNLVEDVHEEDGEESLSGVTETLFKTKTKSTGSAGAGSLGRAPAAESSRTHGVQEDLTTPRDSVDNASEESGLPEAGQGSGTADHQLDDNQIKQMLLEKKISELEEYIQSGDADQFYSFWTEGQGREAKYVYNPWDDLEKHKKELEQLN